MIVDLISLAPLLLSNTCYAPYKRVKKEEKHGIATMPRPIIRCVGNDHLLTHGQDHLWLSINHALVHQPDMGCCLLWNQEYGCMSL